MPVPAESLCGALDDLVDAMRRKHQVTGDRSLSFHLIPVIVHGQPGDVTVALVRPHQMSHRLAVRGQGAG